MSKIIKARRVELCAPFTIDINGVVFFTGGDCLHFGRCSVPTNKMEDCPLPDYPNEMLSDDEIESIFGHTQSMGEARAVIRAVLSEVLE